MSSIRERRQHGWLGLGRVVWSGGLGRDQATDQTHQGETQVDPRVKAGQGKKKPTRTLPPSLAEWMAQKKSKLIYH